MNPSARDARSRLARVRRGGDEGASAVEYALLAAAVAAVIALVVFAFGDMVLRVNQDNCETIRATANPASSCS